MSPSRPNIAFSSWKVWSLTPSFRLYNMTTRLSFITLCCNTNVFTGVMDGVYLQIIANTFYVIWYICILCLYNLGESDLKMVGAIAMVLVRVNYRADKQPLSPGILMMSCAPIDPRKLTQQTDAGVTSYACNWHSLLRFLPHISLIKLTW